MVKSITGHTKDLGDNFHIRRVLPSLEKRSVGPFVFFDHFGPVPIVTGQELVVRAHPHIGLATITFLYDGIILHRDSLGVEEKIQPNETNWMVAGNGIVHSERSLFDKKYEILEGIQTWIALPKEKEDIDPSFQHLSESEIPVYKENGITLRLLGGNFLNLKSPAIVHSSLLYADIHVEKEASKVEWQLQESVEAAIYVSRGSIEVEGAVFGVGSMILFEKGSKITFSPQLESRLMLLGGEPLSERRILYWNFVSTSQEKIDQAKVRWENDEFPKVINETERIPLPPPIGNLH